MRVLGINSIVHDLAAALVVDGQVVPGWRRNQRRQPRRGGSGPRERGARRAQPTRSQSLSPRSTGTGSWRRKHAHRDDLRARQPAHRARR
ncbi:hypothetical protein E1182_27940 [Micromonospora sp. KC721]|nr:hypothetical protein E1182_27940 [Micromonospora sp. KC721]